MLDYTGHVIEIGDPVSAQFEDGKIVEGNVIGFELDHVVIEDHESKEHVACQRANVAVIATRHYHNCVKCDNKFSCSEHKEDCSLVCLYCEGD